MGRSHCQAGRKEMDVSSHTMESTTAKEIYQKTSQAMDGRHQRAAGTNWYLKARDRDKGKELGKKRMYGIRRCDNNFTHMVLGD